MSEKLINQETESSIEYSTDTTPSCFIGKEPDPKFLQKLAEKQSKKNQQNIPCDKTESPSNQLNEELGRFNIVDQVFGELTHAYHFISVDQKLYVYIDDLGYWKLITDSESQRELRSRVDRKWRGRVNKSNLQEIYEWLVLDAEHKSPDIFREGRHYLNFSDVAYNWKKDSFTESRKELYFRYALNVPYKCKWKENGAFNSFLNDVFGSDADTRKAFQLFFGLALSDQRSLKYAFILHGPANSGKSVTMNFLRYLVGNSNVSSVSFSQMSSEFHTAQLHNKRINCSAEVSGVTLSRLDVFRALCGNDEVLVSNKMKDPFSFVNRCLLIFACNVLPKIEESLEAESVIERLIIFPFYHVKPREKWDPKILEHLCEDYPSAIAFAIQGLKALEDNDHVIKESPAMLICKDEYGSSYDSFTMFAKKYLKRTNDSILTSARIYEAYKKYCDTNDCVPMPANVWPRILKRNLGCIATTCTDKSNGYEQRIRAYKGVAFTKKIDDLLNNQPPVTENTVAEIVYDQPSIKSSH